MPEAATTGTIAITRVFAAPRELVWQAFTGNWPSRKVAWRLGFTVEGTLRRYLPQRGARRDAWIGTLRPWTVRGSGGIISRSPCPW